MEKYPVTTQILNFYRYKPLCNKIFCKLLVSTSIVPGSGTHNSFTNSDPSYLSLKTGLIYLPKAEMATHELMLIEKM